MRRAKAFTTLAFVTLGLGGLTLSLPSCSKPPSWSNSEWNGDWDGPVPQPPSLSEDKSPATLAGQQIEFRVQAVEGIPVQGSYLKTLSKNGTPLWAKTKFLEAKNLPQAMSVREALKHQDVILKKMDSWQTSLRCKFSGEAASELRWKGSWLLVFKRTCESASGQAFEVVMSSRGKLISHNLAGAGLSMEEQTATLYPKGPKMSQLKAVKVSVATTPNYLSGPSLEVVSDSGVKFTDLAQMAQTGPRDDHFDMLQAYYYSTKALEWVNQHAKFQLTNLRLRTQVGFPERSNVAFYFNREVRIGTGDDITFSHMAWDPSIVIHETMHAVIEALTHLPLGVGEGGSLQEGLADILTALQLDNPNMGEASFKGAAFQRTLDSSMKLSEKSGGLYHDSLIFSGTLWEIKERAGQPVSESIVLYMLAHLAPSSGFWDVSTQFQGWLNSYADPEKVPLVESILKQRGWL